MDMRPRRPSPVAVDRLVATTCAVLGALNVRPGGPGGPAEPAAFLASPLGVLGGVLLLWRRSRPAHVLAAVLVAYGLQVLAAGPVVPVTVWVAVHASARHGSRRGGIAAALAGLGALLVVLLAVGAGDVAVAYGLVGLVAALTGALGAVAADRRDALADAGAAAERLRIARDLHDVVGHGLGAIAVQAGTARVALDAGETAQARRSVEAIERASRSSLREVRWVLALLRDAPAPGLAAVPDVVAAAREAGLSVDLDVTGDARALPPDASAAAYRVVQEALTNVLRHSDARHVEVRIGAGGPATEVRVVDDGPGTTSGGAGAGQGLRGMRERVTGTGGSLEAGPLPHGGWQVLARWPGAAP